MLACKTALQGTQLSRNGTAELVCVLAVSACPFLQLNILRKDQAEHFLKFEPLQRPKSVDHRASEWSCPRRTRPGSTRVALV